MFRYFVLTDEKQVEHKNPKTDIQNEVIPIIRADESIGVEVNFNEIPAPNASILVKTPSNKNHFQPHLYFFEVSSELNASRMNFAPRNINIPKTIGFERGAR